jgi:hypothetical protein
LRAFLSVFGPLSALFFACFAARPWLFSGCFPISPCRFAAFCVRLVNLVTRPSSVPLPPQARAGKSAAFAARVLAMISARPAADDPGYAVRHIQSARPC